VLSLEGATDTVELRFVDPRTFGELFAVAPGDVAAVAPGLARQGPEPLDRGFGVDRLAAVLGRRRRRLTDLLTDQSVLAGVGNIYSDEILHAAALRTDRLASDVGLDDLVRLHSGLRSVLRRAIAARGSSLLDGQYVDLNGRPGRFQLQHQVYGRAGQECRRCGGVVERVRWAGRSSFSCPGCQR
jgi:formamidopyrimidine-DNA glycosylase